MAMLNWKKNSIALVILFPSIIFDESAKIEMSYSFKPFHQKSLSLKYKSINQFALSILWFSRCWFTLSRYFLSFSLDFLALVIALSLDFLSLTIWKKRTRTSKSHKRYSILKIYVGGCFTTSGSSPYIDICKGYINQKLTQHLSILFVDL